MHGLADIRAMNDTVLKDELARRQRVAKNAAYNSELAEATDFVHRLRNNLLIDEHDRNSIADLLVSAYGIQED